MFPIPAKTATEQETYERSTSNLCGSTSSSSNRLLDNCPWAQSGVADQSVQYRADRERTIEDVHVSQGAIAEALVLAGDPVLSVYSRIWGDTGRNLGITTLAEAFRRLAANPSHRPTPFRPNSGELWASSQPSVPPQRSLWAEL